MARGRGAGRRSITKPGRHGTLYLYRIVYQDFPGPVLDVHFWAYSREHAEERFWGPGEDLDWEILSIERCRAT